MNMHKKSPYPAAEKLKAMVNTTATGVVVHTKGRTYFGSLAASVTSIFAKLAPAQKKHIIRVFGNIIKYIKMAASANFGNMFSVVGASAFLPFLPMLPIQVLTNSLLYDFSQRC